MITCVGVVQINNKVIILLEVKKSTVYAYFNGSFTVVRDYDGLTYFREWSGGILAGGFEPVAKPAFLQGIPNNFQFGLLPDDWDHFRKGFNSQIFNISLKIS